MIEKSKIIDGHKIEEGDIVFAVPSSGVHTNGYSLVRKLMERDASLSQSSVGPTSFFDSIMQPHRCYSQPLVELANSQLVTGMAHITGGGIAGNVNRIMPQKLSAVIDVSKIKILPVFKAIRDAGSVSDEDMLSAFNVGTGLVGVCKPQHYAEVETTFARFEDLTYPIGVVESGDSPVVLNGSLSW